MSADRDWPASETSAHDIVMGDLLHPRASHLRSGCGDHLVLGHEYVDPECPVCVEMYSDAPEWTI